MVIEMCKRGAAVALSSFVLAQAAPCQLVGPGLQWVGTAGTAAGSHVPSCTPQTVMLIPLDTVTVSVYGDPTAPFVLFGSTGLTPCVMFPGVGGGLLLGLPLATLSVGVLNMASPCLSCPPAFASLTFTVPRIPHGIAFGLQALTFGGGSPAFTVAVFAGS